MRSILSTEQAEEKLARGLEAVRRKRCQGLFRGARRPL